MKFNYKIGSALVVAGLVLCGSWAKADTAKKVDADNSAINQRDRKSNEVTAETQSKATDNDVDLTRRIRQALTADDKLSTYAENIKIVTINGVATLKGPVKSLAEKRRVAMHAQKIIGKNRIKNEIEVVKK